MRPNAKRWSLSARTSEALNIALKDAAARAGRSVMQEVEMRLEASFRDEALKAHISEAVAVGVTNALMLSNRSASPVAEPISSPLPSYAQ